jgi:hypothetical protein
MSLKLSILRLVMFYPFPRRLAPGNPHISVHSLHEMPGLYQISPKSAVFRQQASPEI